MDTIMMLLGVSTAVLSSICFVLGVCLTIIARQIISRAKAKTFEEDLQRQIDGAKKEAENIIRSAQIDAASETIKKKEQFVAEANQVRAELHEVENRLNKREDTLNRQAETFQQREDGLKLQDKEVGRA